MALAGVLLAVAATVIAFIRMLAMPHGHAIALADMPEMFVAAGMVPLAAGAAQRPALVAVTAALAIDTSKTSTGSSSPA